MYSQKYIYADNFRGFTEALIPLEKVNFFVGENSTGKTSILALVNLLLSSRFWFNLQFNSQDHEFGGFRDIVSAKTNGSSFSFGLIQRVKSKKHNVEGWGGIFASFTEFEGLPRLDFVAHVRGNKVLFLRAKEDTFKYLAGELPDNFSKRQPEQVFKEFKKQSNNSDHKYQELPQKLPRPMPLLPLLTLVDAFLQTKGKYKHNFHVQMPIEFDDLVWLAPIRTRPRRTYDGYGKEFSPEGEHTPYELRKRLKSENKAKAFQEALRRFGKSSGLFRNVTVHNLGKEASAPFELLVTLSNSPLRINSVGYGVSQVLPVIVEMLVRPQGSWFAIQQPEVHLHPKAQAALGEILFQMVETEKKCFLVETHSDFMIDRFRLNMRKRSEVRAQVLFFERSGEGNKLTPILIQQNGEYLAEQPATFRDFFLKEQLNILGL